MCRHALCNSMVYSLPVSSVRGIFQARILEWVAISFSRESSQPSIESMFLASPALAGRFFTSWASRERKEPVQDCGPGLEGHMRGD